MTAPRLEIDLAKLEHNAGTLVERLHCQGIAVTGVTKATLGSPEIARAMLRGGVHGLGDSRIENIQAMREEQVSAPMTLIRSPMLSQTHRVVAHADVSFNTELAVITELSRAAQDTGLTHGIVLMVELGDLREGIMPDDLQDTVRAILRLPNIELKGIGTNLACRSGVTPDPRNMQELSSLACSVEKTFGIAFDTVSGGNSANLNWVFSGADTGRINNLRLGEAILLGREPLHREPIPGLYLDAVILVAEVIESKTKPSQPRGVIARSAFGDEPNHCNRGDISQCILALGLQDVDARGLLMRPDVNVLGVSSDHLIVETHGWSLTVGRELQFQLNYSALLRAMTSPFVARIMKNESPRPEPETPLAAHVAPHSASS